MKMHRREDLFAETPPETKNMLLSFATNARLRSHRKEEGQQGCSFKLLDVRRASFHAKDEDAAPVWARGQT